MKKKPTPRRDAIHRVSKAEAAPVPDLLPPTSDVVFKYIFGDEKNKPATAGLLGAIMDAKLKETDISFGDPHLKREFPKDKLGVLDIFVRLKTGKTVAVEMQTGKFSNIFKRLEYYISKLTVAQIGKGGAYPEIQPVVFILIATKPVLKATAKYHSKFVMMEENDHYALHDLRTIHIIELSKLPPQSQGRLAAWMKFMKTNKKEDLMALVKKNPELKPAGEALLSASTVRALRAWYARDLSKDVDTLDQIDYAVKEAERKAKRALSAERRKTKAAEAEKEKAMAEKDKAVSAALRKAEAEKEKAEDARKKVQEAQKKAEKILDLIKQGYPVDQVEKMIRKKGRV